MRRVEALDPLPSDPAVGDGGGPKAEPHPSSQGHSWTLTDPPPEVKGVPTPTPSLLVNGQDHVCLLGLRVTTGGFRETRS